MFTEMNMQPKLLPKGVPQANVLRQVGLPPTRPSCTRRACVPHLVAAAAIQWPNATALSAGSERMTYSQLDARAAQLAGHLRSLGVGPEVPVGLCLERSFDYVVAALAIWKAGGAYLPLDPNWPVEHREFVLTDAQAPVLITRSSLQSNARHIVNLDRDALAILGAQPTSAAAEVKRENLAYIIYTSGSTGQPKGVEVTHGNLLNLIFWHRRTFGITAADCASHLSGLAFDAAVWELWPYLTAGSNIVLCDENVRTSPDALRDWIVAQRVTVAFVPTALAEPMLTGAWPQTTALRFLLTGADTLHRYPSPSLPFRFVNNYGPTECTVVSTSYEVPAGAGAAKNLPPIGTPIANTHVYLLDEHGRPVPDGETGEIYIGGTSVARGYRNRPELTWERFLKNPFSPAVDARMYRTGDLGCLLPEGQISFRGRADRQEKIRGYRIEPEEIVNILNLHPDVATSAVAADGATPHEKRLVAYVVPVSGASPSSTDLREFLGRRLPEYMIPSAFIRMASLPLNSSGKLDREALPAPAPENTLGQSNFRAPESVIEVHLAKIITELLHIPRVGLDDNFFLLGGHSLLGAQVVLRARERFGVVLTLRHLFETQTVGKLAAEIERLLFSTLEAMSDEEAAQLLRGMEAT